MSFTCAPQFTGLVRGESNGKHRSNGKAIAGEMGSERISASETLDQTRKYLNEYDQENHSGFSVWDDMKNRADSYTQEVKCVNKHGTEITRNRKLRSDAVIGVAVIINPPYEECKNWSSAQYQKFYEDTEEALETFRPKIFRKENKVFGVQHKDEGYGYDDFHKHDMFDAIDEDGRYCGNELDAKFMADFNKFYPKFMRDKGWEMDDLDVTDWDKYKTDSDYRSERKAKNRTQGKSVNQHMRNKAVKNLQDSEEILQDVHQTKVQMDAEKAEFDKTKSDNQKELDTQTKKIQWNSKITKQQNQVITSNTNKIATQQQTKDSLELSVTSLKAQITALTTQRDNLQADVDKRLTKASEDAQKKIDDANLKAEQILEKARKEQQDAKDAKELYEQAKQAVQRKSEDVPESLLDFCNRKTFTQPKMFISTDNFGRSKKVMRKGEDGKIITEKLTVMEYYQREQHGKQRRQQLSEKDDEIIKKADNYTLGY